MADHGTLAQYKAGCLCLPCRVANADYERERRRRKAQGQPSPGAVINGHRTAVMLLGLLSEGYRPIDLMVQLKLPRESFYRHLRSSPVQLVVAARVRRKWLQDRGES